MLATLAEDWKRQWRAEGKAEALVRVAEHAFGPLSSDLRERVFGADEATLDAWFDQLLDGADLDTVFGPSH